MVKYILFKSVPTKKIACTSLCISMFLQTTVYVNTVIRRPFALLFSMSALGRGAGCVVLGPQRAALYGCNTQMMGSDPRFRAQAVVVWN